MWIVDVSARLDSAEVEMEIAALDTSEITHLQGVSLASSVQIVYSI